MFNFDTLDKLKRSHSLVYRNDKMFSLDRATLIVSLAIAIVTYHFFVDDTFPVLKTMGYLSVFTFVLLYIIDFLLYPFIFKYIFGQGIDGVWEGEFLVEEPEKKNIPIKRFEVSDFGRKCLITVETDSFISHSIVAKLITKEENSSELRFIYEVIYVPGSNKRDHYGMTEMTFYKDKRALPKGEYYTKDENTLRYGRIQLNRKIK